MKAKDVIIEIRTILKQTKDQGHTSVSIDALENYLSIFDKDVENDTYYKSLDHETNLTSFKAENDRNIATAINQNTSNIATFKAATEAGQSALKSSMVINGGASVALLAFTGKIWNTSVSEVVASSLSSSIFIFCIGVLCAAFAAGTRYLSQLFFSTTYTKVGTFFQILSIFTVVFSYFLFAYGAFEVSTSLNEHLGL